MLKDQVDVIFEKLNELARYFIENDDMEGLKMLSEYVREFQGVTNSIFERIESIVALQDKIIEGMKRIEK